MSGNNIWYRVEEKNDILKSVKKVYKIEKAERAEE